ncbi:hypothetical protein E4K65_17330 [Bradyrhizobium niftali]|uniref:Uncharacterized protein n=1 Tax=Bradyrhizobium niftali TaxID=2560055 RepID=A0A4Y9LVJ8_9BRAD|nr:hypothetical protein E4K65_17330 [Bradyrhizobium niftali]
MTRQFRHSSPRLSSVSRCLGPTQVVTPFHHLSGDSHHHHPLLGAGPITASMPPSISIASRPTACSPISARCRWSLHW